MTINSIKCTHERGLACRICYNQRFGLDWNPKKEAVYQELKKLPETIPTPIWPFEPIKKDE